MILNSVSGIVGEDQYSHFGGLLDRIFLPLGSIQENKNVLKPLNLSTPSLPSNLRYAPASTNWIVLLSAALTDSLFG